MLKAETPENLPEKPHVIANLEWDQEVCEEAESVLITEHIEHTHIRIELARLAQEGVQQGKGFITTLWSLATPILGIASVAGFLQGNLAVSALCALGFATALKLNSLTDTVERQRAALLVSDANPQWLGDLLEALHFPSPRLEAIAKNLLIHLLPQTTRSDWERLSEDQRLTLYNCLNPPKIGSEVDLICAILTFVASVGDTEALPHVEHLVNRRAWTSLQTRVKREAMACQTCLEAKEQANQIATASSALAPLAAPVPLSPEEMRAAEEVDRIIKEVQQAFQQPGMRIPFLVASWCVIVPFTGAMLIGSIIMMDILPAFIWALLTLMGTQLHRLTLLPRQTEALKQLAQYDSVRGVAFMTEVLEWPDDTCRTAAVSSLCKILPKMTASDATRLHEKHRQILYRRLNAAKVRQDYELIKAILTALEQVGDHNAIPHVMPLANMVGTSAAHRRIREVAHECLQYLNQRGDLSWNAQTLLRASYSQADAPENLLRPANHDATPPEQLLRPVNGDTD